MKRPRRLTTLCLAMLLSFTSILWASDHMWQEGTLTSAERREERGIKKTNQTKYDTDPTGTTETSTTTVEKADKADIYMYDTISDGKRFIVARQLTNAFFVTAVKAQVGDKVEFSLEGGNLYLKRAGGKESRLRVVKTSLTSAPDRDPAYSY